MSVLFILSVMFLAIFVLSIFIAYLIAKRESKYAFVVMFITGCIGLIAIILAAVSLFYNI